MGNMKNIRMTVKFFLYCMLIFLLLVVLIGCEELLEEALTKDVTIEEPLFDSATVTGAEQTIPITSNMQLSKGLFNLGKAMGFVVSPVTPPDAALFSRALSTGNIKITGTVVNNDTGAVIFGIYFGTSGTLSNPQIEATLIATMNLAGSETKSISGFGSFNQSKTQIVSNLLSFFSANPGISTIYVYLTGEPQPVNITVQSLAIILGPVFHISQIVEPDEAYALYIDHIEAIAGVTISGSLKNNGSETVDILLTISPTSGSASWAGVVLEGSINPGETLNFEDWSDFLVAGGVNRLEGAIEHLVDPGESIRADLYLESNSNINIDILSIVLGGTLTVTL